MQIRKFNTAINLTLLIVLTLCIFVGHFLNLSYEKPRSTSSQHLSFAYNLVKYGVFDDNSSDSPFPDYRREPVYPFLLGISMLLHPGIDLANQDAKCLTLGEKGCLEIIIYLKIVDIMFLLACAILSGYVAYYFTNRSTAFFFTFIFVSLSGRLGEISSRFNNDIVATFFIVLVSLMSLLLMTKKYTNRNALFTGFTFAVLALTKAIFYYYIFFASVLMFVWWRLKGNNSIRSIRNVALVVLGFYLIVAPWIIRNYIQLGTFSISGRSGIVLLQRANLSDIVSKDYLGSILFFASPLKSEFLRNEMKTRIDPEVYKKLKNNDAKQDAYAISTYAKKVLKLKNAELNDYMLDKAKKRIFSNFGQNILAAVPITLRGIFMESGYGFSPRFSSIYGSIGIRKYNINLSKYFVKSSGVVDVLSLIAFFSVFLFSISMRKWGLFWFLIPSIYFFMMHALFTQFENRYVLQLLPIYTICWAIILWKIIDLLKVWILKDINLGH